MFLVQAIADFKPQMALGSYAQDETGQRVNNKTEEVDEIDKRVR